MIKTINGEITENKKISTSIYFLEVTTDPIISPVYPGQFMQISCSGKNETLLRRPFSILSASSDNLSFFYKVVGKGTQNLAEKRVGDSISMLGPCGNSFTPPSKQGVNLLLGGGLGIAPMIFLSQLYSTCAFHIWYGTSWERELIDISPFVPADVPISTHSDWYIAEDGSATNNGHLLKAYSNEVRPIPTKVYSCGPIPMMKSFGNHFKEMDVPIEVSLESRMACGFGVCLGCSFKTTRGMRTVCSDGPVFQAKDVIWESLQ